MHARYVLPNEYLQLRWSVPEPGCSSLVSSSRIRLGVMRNTILIEGERLVTGKGAHLLFLDKGTVGFIGYA